MTTNNSIFNPLHGPSVQEEVTKLKKEERYHSLTAEDISPGMTLKHMAVGSIQVLEVLPPSHVLANAGGSPTVLGIRYLKTLEE